MRVLHIISGGDTGGAKTHVFTLLKQLQKEIDVELVCLSDGIFYQEAVAIGLKVSLIAQKRRMDLSILKTIADKVNNEKFSIIHCHGARANFLSFFFRKKVKVPIITTIHSDYKLDFAHSFYKNMIFTPINRISLSKMDGYLAVTGIFKRDLVSRGFQAERIHVIYNGIDIQERSKDYSNIQARNMVLGCATRLMPIKGTDVLLKALAVMKEKGYQPILRIAGNGDLKYTDKLKSFVQENDLEEQVAFLGFVKDMEGFYETIDINILPSYTEGFP
ncbi:MAG: glycosyltransferase family 4 protein, partial [Vallitaleaceae bacterium]|nr:glycosyltransferase family 4 protein [Vallitaleaceae bacterium]